MNVDVIRAIAREKGLSLTQLEQKAGISNGTIGKWKNSSPTFDTLLKVSDALDISLIELIKKIDLESVVETSAEKKKEIFLDCDAINTAFGRRCIYCTDVKEKDHLERFVFQIIPMDEDESAGRHLYISIDEGNKKLLTSLEDSSGRTTKYGLGCKISYCPNCGRKL